MKTAKSVCSLCSSVCAKYLIWQSCFIIKLREKGREWVFRSNDTTRLLLYNIEMKENTRKKGVVGEERRSSPWWISEHWVTSIGEGGKEISFIIILGARVCVHEQPDLFDRSLLVFQCFMLEHTLLNRMREREKMSHSNHHASGLGVDRKKKYVVVGISFFQTWSRH